MPGTETKHKVRDVNVRMLRGGSGPPLLFLHGANGLPVWLPVFDLLSKQFEVFVPEHPGFGTSDNPPWMRNIGDLAMYYLDFLDEFGPHEVHLVGQSLGGWAAAEAAVRNCSRIKTLSLLGPAGIRIKGLPSGDNFIWSPEEAVRNLYHNQAIPDQMLAHAADRRAGRHHADQPLRRREVRLGAALVQSVAGALAASHHGADAGDVGQGGQAVPQRLCGALGREDSRQPRRDRAGMRSRAGGREAGDHREGNHPALRGDTLMQFTFFHLMPYRPLDMAERHKHRAAWVVLPNTLYDPKKGADEYQSYIEQLVYAEKLGFDVIAVNEHHQTAYGLMPAPNLIAANLIARTTKAKIAIIGRALPLVNNPVNIAEEFAMLDNLSRGRIITGFVRGIGNEYHSTGINPHWSHERYQEAHDLIVQAWTKPGPFSFEGEHFNNRYVNIWPRPYQTPHPPIWIPSMGSSETVKWAAAPERKYPFLVTFSAASWWRAISTSIATRPNNTATRPRPIRSAGRRRSTSPTPTSAPRRRPRRASRRCSTTSSRCRSRCCCRPATCRCRR